MPEWDPATIYQLVFGPIATFLAVPGAAAAYVSLQSRHPLVTGMRLHMHLFTS